MRKVKLQIKVKNLPSNLTVEEMNFIRLIEDDGGIYNITRETMYPVIRTMFEKSPDEIMGLDYTKDIAGIFTGSDYFDAKPKESIKGRHLTFLIPEEIFNKLDIEKIREQAIKYGYKGINTIQDVYYEHYGKENKAGVIDFVIDSKKQREPTLFYDNYITGKFDKVPMWFSNEESQEMLFDYVYGEFIEKTLNTKIDNKDFYPYTDKFPSPGFTAYAEMLWLISLPDSIVKKVEDCYKFKRILGDDSYKIFGTDKWMAYRPISPVVFKTKKVTEKRKAALVFYDKYKNKVPFEMNIGKNLWKVKMAFPDLPTGQIHNDCLESFVNPKLIFDGNKHIITASCDNDMNVEIDLSDINQSLIYTLYDKYAN